MRAPRTRLLTLIVLGLGACQPAPRAPVQADPPAAVAPVPQDASVWHVDANESTLRVLVYRDGPLARLGHNHVIASRAIEGTVALAAPVTRSTLRLRVPLRSFTLDEPAARAAAGADFAGDVPEEARAATRENLLSDALLDAARHPHLRIDGLVLERPPPDALLRARVSLAGRVNELRLPARVEIGPDTLTIDGALTVRHGDLGLTPFSAVLGALRVRDDFELRYRLLAKRR